MAAPRRGLSAPLASAAVRAASSHRPRPSPRVRHGPRRLVSADFRSHRGPRCRRLALGSALALGLALALGASPLAAQSVAVQAREQATGSPLAGAIVDVLDPAGRVVVRGILSADGRRTLPVGAAGTYRVQVRRIGFEPFVSAPVSVAGTATASVALDVPARRIVLGTVTVTGERRCRDDARRSGALATLWEEARKALTAAELARGDAALAVEARPFERTRDADGRVTAERVRLPRTSDGRPFVARPAAELSAEGYVRLDGDGFTFYAPDETVLLSEEFERDHCFEIVRGSGETAGLLGVRFTPAPDRRRADVAGTIWLDSATVELRHVDFRFVDDRLPRAALDDGATGGQVVFDRLGSGLWVVSAWRIAMPRFEGSRLTQRSRPSGYVEVGGVMTPSAARETPPSAALAPYLEMVWPARVAGAVYDSLAGAPLEGAIVWAVPTDDATSADMARTPIAVRPVADTTDAAGRYALDALPAGSYRLGFEHPALDTLGVVPTRWDVRLKPGALVVGDLAVPSLASLSRACTPAAGRAGGNLVFGRVRAAGDDRALVDALVRVSWFDADAVSAAALGGAPVSVETRTDTGGIFRVCGVPGDAIATVQAAGPRSSTGEVTTTIGAHGVARVDLALAEVADGEAAPAPGTIAGSVTDSAGRPLVAAAVVLDGTPQEARTDSAGRFRLEAVPAGTQSIEVRAIGLAPARRRIDVAPGDTAHVALALARSQVLETVVIAGRSSAALPSGARDAMRRARIGVGHMMTAEDVYRDGGIANALRRVPGLEILSQGPGRVLRFRREDMHSYSPTCDARVFIDGREVMQEDLWLLPERTVAAVEAFRRPGTSPIFTSGASRFGADEACGVIIVWTDTAR